MGDENTTKTEAATAPKAAAQADPQTQAPAQVDALIERWISTLRGGAIAQHTPAWNELTASLPALKAAILEQGA